MWRLQTCQRVAPLPACAPPPAALPLAGRPHHKPVYSRHVCSRPATIPPCAWDAPHVPQLVAESEISREGAGVSPPGEAARREMTVATSPAGCERHATASLVSRDARLVAAAACVRAAVCSPAHGSGSPRVPLRVRPAHVVTTPSHPCHRNGRACALCSPCHPAGPLPGPVHGMQ